MPIIVNIDVMLAKRKTGKAKGIRFMTLDRICKALDCKPGDILEYEDENS